MVIIIIMVSSSFILTRLCASFWFYVKLLKLTYWSCCLSSLIFWGGSLVCELLNKLTKRRWENKTNTRKGIRERSYAGSRPKIQFHSKCMKFDMLFVSLCCKLHWFTVKRSEITSNNHEPWTNWNSKEGCILFVKEGLIHNITIWTTEWKKGHILDQSINQSIWTNAMNRR